jgi:hypothetical protein
LARVGIHPLALEKVMNDPQTAFPSSPKTKLEDRMPVPFLTGEKWAAILRSLLIFFAHFLLFFL